MLLFPRFDFLTLFRLTEIPASFLPYQAFPVPDLLASNFPFRIFLNLYLYNLVFLCPFLQNPFSPNLTLLSLILLYLFLHILPLIPIPRNPYLLPPVILLASPILNLPKFLPPLLPTFPLVLSPDPELPSGEAFFLLLLSLSFRSLPDLFSLPAVLVPALVSLL